MAGVITFNQYIGGADTVETEQIFPSSQRSVVYNFGTDITGWTFQVDYKTIVANAITFDRTTGAPNFSSSQIIGYFPGGTINTSTYVNVINSASGTIAVTIPAKLYTGPILPDARSHTPITIVGVTWTDSNTPATIETHRWAFVQSWEAGVVPGDPVLDQNYSAIVFGG